MVTSQQGVTRGGVGMTEFSQASLDRLSHLYNQPQVDHYSARVRVSYTTEKERVLCVYLTEWNLSCGHEIFFLQITRKSCSKYMKFT